MYSKIFFVCLVIGCCGCHSVDHHKISAFGTQGMDKMLERYVPIGTPVSEAKSIMEEAGFSCHFSTGIWGKIQEIELLTCYRLRKRRSNLRPEYWAIQFSIDENQEVFDVNVRTVAFDELPRPELDTIASGIMVEFDHNAVDAREVKNTQGQTFHMWHYVVSVRGADVPIRIREWGSLALEEGEWVHIWRRTASEFEDVFGCPGGLLRPGQNYSFDRMRSLGTLHGGDKTKWYFVGEKPDGNLIKGEAVIHGLPIPNDKR